MRTETPGGTRSGRPGPGKADEAPMMRPFAGLGKAAREPAQSRTFAIHCRQLPVRPRPASHRRPGGDRRHPVEAAISHRIRAIRENTTEPVKNVVQRTSSSCAGLGQRARTATPGTGRRGRLGAFVPSFERRRRARACLVRDRYWQAVHRALLPILSPADAVLMPRGDWDAFPCAVRHYDAVIEPGEATVLVLHKGRLPGIRKSSLAAIVAEWGCIYANEVFAVFGRSRRSALEARCGLWRRHLRHVHAYLKAREAKRREVHPLLRPSAQDGRDLVLGEPQSGVQIAGLLRRHAHLPGQSAQARGVRPGGRAFLPDLDHRRAFKG